MRRGPTKSNCSEKQSVGASPSTTKNFNDASSQFSQLKEKRSTTASYCPPVDQPTAQTGADIQLASGEEDISDESDSLLQ